MCEVLTPLDRLSLSEEYKYLSCTYNDNGSRAEIYTSKVSTLIEEEAEMNEKAQYSIVIGNRERS